ncbi:MAG: glutamate racemase [Alteripontixanthobacter sp.]
MTDSTAPILLFDSGVGGLTVLGELRKLLPEAPILYFADTAALPYGEKTEAEIAARVAGLLGRLSERYRPRLACIACNTASTIALGMVREVLEIPIVGTVPAIKPAAALTQTGTIGLLGTQATIRQVYVDRLEAEFAADKRLIRHAAPGLVIAAESKLHGEAPDPAIIANAVSQLRAHDGGEAIDTVVLACTHFPLLADELGAELGPQVKLVDGSRGIARRIADLTRGEAFERAGPDTLLTSGPVANRAAFAALLQPYGLTRLERFGKTA